MHLLNTLNLTENPKTEWFHSNTTNVFYVVLKDAVVLPTHTLFQLKTNLLFEVGALVHSQVGIPIVIMFVIISRSPEVLYR